MNGQERLNDRCQENPNGWKFGFGRANVWYASENNEELEDYMEKLLY